MMNIGNTIKPEASTTRFTEGLQQLHQHPIKTNERF